MMSDSGKKSAKKLVKPGNSESVKVIVRCRPMSEKEVSEGYEKIVTAFPERGVIEVTDPKRESEGSPKQFTFDAVYDSNAKQTEMYDETFRPIVDSVLVGFNGTIFAYGQTGAGKTYTMEGIRNDPERKGVIPNSFDHIFNHIARSQNQQYLVTASYLEIYQEEIRDLLSKDHRKCEIKEKPDTGVYVKDLMVYVCKSVKEIEHVMSLGNQNRSVGATNMNLHSSRSHAIFIITVEHTDLGLDGENHIRMGKLNLVDLAGSERQAKTGVAGDRQKESIKINLSLSALGNVISALVDGKSTHIPYRDSKLTRLLQDSLGGNARTIMVANIGPASYNYDETLTTLRYANRAKNIRNRPQVNEDPKEALLKEFQEEIARLKAQLAAKVGKRKKEKDIEEIIGNGSEEEELDEEESEEESEEAFLQKQEALLVEEHAAILNDQNLIAEEKEKLLNELLSRQDQLKEEQEARDQLHLKIQAMESKLLSGGKNIIDHTNEQQRELEQRRQELAEQKRLERAIQQKLVLEEETTLEIKETYTSLQQEVEIKTKKLKKLFARLQALKQEIIDIQEINSHERQEQEQIQNELMKQLKLTYLIIENFVPPEEKTKILSRVIYDEDEDLWCFQSRPEGSLLSRRPVASNASRRPVTERAVVIGNFSHHPRYKSDNICLPVLDMPMRTTQDYRYPSVDPLTRAVLDDALKGEEDEDIDVSHTAFNIRPKTSKKPSRSRRHFLQQKPPLLFSETKDGDSQFGLTEMTLEEIVTPDMTEKAPDESIPGPPDEIVVEPEEALTAIVAKPDVSRELSTPLKADGVIDTHCHLHLLFRKLHFRGSFQSFRQRYRNFFSSQYEACVTVFHEPENFEDIRMWKNLLCEQGVYAAFGCHPHYALKYTDAAERYLKAALENPKVVALGEIGLDYSRNNSCPRNIQKGVLRRQIQLALERNLPLIIHCREAHEDCLPIMKELLPKDYKIHLHCFTDEWFRAKQWIEAFSQLCIGFTNVLSFPSATPVRKTVRRLPLERILLETDAPYFVPRCMPRYTKHSNPGMVIHVAEQVAKIKGIPLKDVLTSCRTNATVIYGI